MQVHVFERFPAIDITRGKDKVEDFSPVADNQVDLETVEPDYGALCLYLNKHLGCSFQKWLNNLRIEESKELLRSYPHKSVKKISSMVGITHSYNFPRWSRQVTGMTPQEWRRQ